MRSEQCDDIKLNFNIYNDRLNLNLKPQFPGFSSYFLIVSDFIGWAKKIMFLLVQERFWCRFFSCLVFIITNLDPINLGYFLKDFLTLKEFCLILILLLHGKKR